MIYIIEDDENIRNLVQVALNGSGYETAAFETAEEALGAFKVKAPQLAIFDLCCREWTDWKQSVKFVQTMHGKSSRCWC